MAKPAPKVPTTIPVNPVMLADAVRQVVDACREWQTVHEQETTNRAAIAAQRDVFIEKIRADRDVLINHLEGAFAQQGRALDGLFQSLDRALETGNPDLVAPILGGIVETVKASPLGDIATLDQRMKDDSFTFVLGKG